MTKRVIKFDSLANSVAAADQATAQAIEAAESTKEYVDDKASLLSSQIEAAAKGYKPFETKADMDAFTPGDDGDYREIAQVMNDPTVGNNGIYRWDGEAWVKRDSLAELKQIKDWAFSEAYDASNIVYDSDGIVESADLVWPDGEAGSISNVETDNFGISSIRFNRPDSKYITIVITRDADGNVTETSSTATGY